MRDEWGSTETKKPKREKTRSFEVTYDKAKTETKDELRRRAMKALQRLLLNKKIIT